MTYRIYRYNKKFKLNMYFAGNLYVNGRWVLTINESNIYFNKNDAKKDIKKYGLKNVEILEEE